MQWSRIALGVLFLTVAGIVLLGVAEAASTHGCSRLVHTSATGSRYYKASIETAPLATDACTAQTSSYKLAAGDCKTWRLSVMTTGAPPAAPDTVILYLVPDFEGRDHGNQGADQWNFFITNVALTGASADGQSVSFCATTTGAAGGNPRAGVYRVVIRACENSGGTGCPGSFATYDIHSDPDADGGLPGAGNSVSGQTQGGMKAGYAPTSFTDGLTPGAADIATYVPGDTRALRLAGINSNSNLVESRITLGIIAAAGSVLESSTANISDSNSVNADAAFSSPLREGDSYPNATSPTKRATIAHTSMLFPSEAWTYFTSAPAGATLTSETQIDAPWGSVNKGIPITCPTLQNPATGTGSVTILNIGVENARCRDGVVTNARGNLAQGSFLRIYYRRASEPTGDATDVPSCDTTVGANGAWQCDSTLDADAVATTGTSQLDYVIDVRQYLETGRTTLLAQSTLTGVFDASTAATLSPASGALACGSGVTQSASVYRKGASPTLTFRLCGARGDQVTWSASASITRDDTGAVEQGPSALTPSGGIYTWSYTIPTGDTAGSYHDAVGMLKTLMVTASGNTATQSAVYGVSDLLTVDAITTLKADCNTPSGAFTIAVDRICMKEGPVRDLSGAIVTRSITASRTYTYGADALTPDSESGITTGTSTLHKKDPLAPEGTWTFTVNMSDAAGNWGMLNKTITIRSPQTPPDPLWVDAPKTVTVGSTVVVSIVSRYDNGTSRLGAASNISVHVEAPDATFPVADQHPTEKTLPNGKRLGYYTISFSTTLAGDYTLYVNTTTDQNEPRAANPFIVTAVPAAASQASLDEWFRWHGPRDLPFANLTTTKTGNTTHLNLSYWHAARSAQVYANASLPPFFNKTTGATIPVKISVHPTGIGAASTEQHTLRLTVNGLAASTNVVLDYSQPSTQSVSVVFAPNTLTEGEGVALNFTLERAGTPVAYTETSTSVYVMSLYQTRAFTSGLKFTTLPNLIGNVTTELALAGLNVDLVKWFNASSGRTMLWQKGDPSGLNDLTKLNRTMALSMRFVTDSDDAIDTGFLSTRAIHLPAATASHASYLRAVPQTPDAVAAQLSPATDYIITTTDPGTGQFLTWDSHAGGLRTLATMEPGKAYTIRPDAATTWTVTN